MHIIFEEMGKLILDVLPGVLVLGAILFIIFGGGLNGLYEVYTLWLYGTCS